MREEPPAGCRAQRRLGGGGGGRRQAAGLLAGQAPGKLSTRRWAGAGGQGLQRVGGGWASGGEGRGGRVRLQDREVPLELRALDAERRVWEPHALAGCGEGLTAAHPRLPTSPEPAIGHAAGAPAPPASPRETRRRYAELRHPRLHGGPLPGRGPAEEQGDPDCVRPPGRSAGATGENPRCRRRRRGAALRSPLPGAAPVWHRLHPSPLHMRPLLPAAGAGAGRAAQCPAGRRRRRAGRGRRGPRWVPGPARRLGWHRRWRRDQCQGVLERRCGVGVGSAGSCRGGGEAKGTARPGCCLAGVPMPRPHTPIPLHRSPRLQALLRYALPIDCKPIRQIQRELEGISEELRVPGECCFACAAAGCSAMPLVAADREGSLPR